MYRIYREEGLLMRPKKPRRHVASRDRSEVPPATAANQTWSMDFMSDELFNGDRIRLLTLVDNFTRVSPWIEIGRSDLPPEAVPGIMLVRPPLGRLA